MGFNQRRKGGRRGSPTWRKLRVVHESEEARGCMHSMNEERKRAHAKLLQQLHPIIG